MATRLPTVQHKGQEYFIDVRLQEFRPVDKPFAPVPFDSELGMKIGSMPGTMGGSDT